MTLSIFRNEFFSLKLFRPKLFRGTSARHVRAENCLFSFQDFEGLTEVFAAGCPQGRPAENFDHRADFRFPTNKGFVSGTLEFFILT